MAESPFTITVYDKNRRRMGWVGDPLSVVAAPRHLMQPTGSLMVASDHGQLANLAAPGARVKLEYDGKHIIGGPVRLLQGQGPADKGIVTLQISDDYRLLGRILGWPVPGAALNAQTATNDVRAGAAETVLKQYVTANATNRLGLPVTCAPDLGRGGSIKVSLRFQPLLDQLLPALKTAGIGVTVQQRPDVRQGNGTYVSPGLLVDVYTPPTYPRTLSERSAVVQAWGWSQGAPDVTRGIIGDQGQGTLRTFTGFTDAPRETAWGDVIEVFGDARDTTDATVVSARIAELLADGAPKSGLSVELAETPTFRYGTAVKVGDKVRLEIGPGVVIDDVLAEAYVTWSREEGLHVTPLVGERTDDPDRSLALAVAKLARNVRTLNAGR